MPPHGSAQARRGSSRLCTRSKQFGETLMRGNGSTGNVVSGGNVYIGLGTLILIIILILILT